MFIPISVLLTATETFLKAIFDRGSVSWIQVILYELLQLNKSVSNLWNGKSFWIVAQNVKKDFCYNLKGPFNWTVKQAASFMKRIICC